MPDPLFSHPRLAALYDAADADRRDLLPYVEMAEAWGAHSAIDVGCGTGTLALRLAAKGVETFGVDPAEASLEIAKRKPGADRVRWHLGDATTLPPVAVDLVTMTGNVAQVFVDDEAWRAALASLRGALHPGGRLVFEVRDPACRAWEQWNRADSLRHAELPQIGGLESWVELTDVSLPLVSFRWTFRFERDGAVLTSDSTLRFRERDEIEASLDEANLSVTEVRDAPDRPGLEWVFVSTPAR